MLPSARARLKRPAPAASAADSQVTDSDEIATAVRGKGKAGARAVAGQRKGKTAVAAESEGESESEDELHANVAAHVAVDEFGDAGISDMHDLDYDANDEENVPVSQRGNIGAGASAVQQPQPQRGKADRGARTDAAKFTPPQQRSKPELSQIASQLLSPAPSEGAAALPVLLPATKRARTAPLRSAADTGGPLARSISSGGSGARTNPVMTAALAGFERAAVQLTQILAPGGGELGGAQRLQTAAHAAEAAAATVAEGGRSLRRGLEAAAADRARAARDAARAAFALCSNAGNMVRRAAAQEGGGDGRGAALAEVRRAKIELRESINRAFE